MLAICIITQNMNFTSVCKYDCVKGGTLNLLYKKFNFVFGGVINIFIMELIRLLFYSLIVYKVILNKFCSIDCKFSVGV